MTGFRFDGQEDLDRVTAAVDSGDVTALLESVPEDARWLVILAARQMRQARATAIDTAAMALEGRLADAEKLAADCARYAGLAQEHLAEAQKPKNERGRS